MYRGVLDSAWSYRAYSLMPIGQGQHLAMQPEGFQVIVATRSSIGWERL